jgi:hypothetical protein
MQRTATVSVRLPSACIAPYSMFSVIRSASGRPSQHQSSDSSDSAAGTVPDLRLIVGGILSEQYCIYYGCRHGCVGCAALPRGLGCWQKLLVGDEGSPTTVCHISVSVYEAQLYQHRCQAGCISTLDSNFISLAALSGQHNQRSSYSGPCPASGLQVMSVAQQSSCCAQITC